MFDQNNQHLGGNPIQFVSVFTNTGVARIFQQGRQKRGSEATERREGVGDFFENSCMKTAFSCTLNVIIRG